MHLKPSLRFLGTVLLYVQEKLIMFPLGTEYRRFGVSIQYVHPDHSTGALLDPWAQVTQQQIVYNL